MRQKSFIQNQANLRLNSAKFRLRVMIAYDADDEVLLPSYM